VFSLLFGYVYDNRQRGCTHASCYNFSFLITDIGCALAIVIASGLLWRNTKRDRRLAIENQL
jgi:hypothetical protein